jgi:hypothetical protein
MRYCLTIAGALFAMTLFVLQPAHAFTFENPGAAQTSGDKQAAGAGYLDLEAKSAMPPIGESLPGIRYNDGPGAYNNGFASPPDRSNSVGPSWLYGR